MLSIFFFQAEDGIRDGHVTGVQTCALPIYPQLHEAAVVDGASRWQRIWYINIPTIVPTMVILLIMNVGQIMAMGFEKILLFQNNLNMESSNVIATFVYEAGLLDGQYSFATAVGLFNVVINFILLVVVNYFARKTSETSLW